MNNKLKAVLFTVLFMIGFALAMTLIVLFPEQSFVILASGSIIALIHSVYKIALLTINSKNKNK